MEVLQLDPDVVVVEGRSRKTFEGIEELAQSIKEHGQIHPIRITSDMKLIAGERRLRACKLAGLKVEAVIKENCSAIELKELELRENLDRKDMTWQERIAGLAELDSLKKSIHGEPKSGRSGVGWSLSDTANLVGVTAPNVHAALQMAKAIEVFPELAASKNQHEATKKLRKITEKLAIAELASRKKASAVGQSVLADENFIVGDAFAGLASLVENSVDFANVDTPYGIDLQENKKIQSEVRTDNDYVEWHKDAYLGNIKIVAEQCFRILKNDRWMLFWFGQEWYLQVYTTLLNAGFKVDKIPAVWYGGVGGAQTMAPEINLARCYEQFFVCRKGDPILIKRGRPNVFCFDKMAPQNKIHPTEKPIELMTELYDTFVLPGQIGISPFIGSGNDLRAGYMHGCHWFGFDTNQDVKNRFLLRVEDDMIAGRYGNNNKG
jgi:DNA modification methylase